VISHRIVLRPESRLDSMSSEAVLNSVLQQVRVPVSMGQ
jgi:MoxR-like ATPase